MCRMGYEPEAHKVQELFLDGKRAEAIAAVPDAFADEISLSGSKERIRDRIQAWEESPVTSLLLGSHDAEAMQMMAEFLL
jgi:alkanesulfonate monooxygenase SsuD/methylene tetrahydromethanopterin reductase-like flavin-dependent oxidoreductase (luciferase family)